MESIKITVAVAASLMAAVAAAGAATAQDSYFFRSKAATIADVPSLTLGPATLPSAKVGSPWSFDFGTLVAARGAGPSGIAWTVTGFPAWFGIDASTGIASGTPTAGSDTTGTVTATLDGKSATASYRLVALAPGVVLSAASLPSAEVGKPWSFDFSSLAAARDLVDPALGWSSASKPSWLALDPSTGVASGTPTRRETVSIDVRATNPEAQAQRSYSLAVTGGAAAISLSATSMSGFTVTPAGASSQVLTITNGGSAPTDAAVATTVAGSFTRVSHTCSAPLAVGGTCAVTVRGTATADGSLAGTVTVAGHAGTVALSGTASGYVANLTASPARVSGLDTSGISSGVSSVAVTIRNTGAVASGVPMPSVSGSFQITSHTCNSALAPGFSCTVNISSVSPTANGPFSGTLSVAGMPLGVALSGTASGVCTTVGQMCSNNSYYLGMVSGVAKFGYPHGYSAVNSSMAYGDASRACSNGGGYYVPSVAEVTALSQGIALANAANSVPANHRFWTTDRSGSAQTVFTTNSSGVASWSGSSPTTSWRAFCIK